jgi:hypothetical protein
MNSIGNSSAGGQLAPARTAAVNQFRLLMEARGIALEQAASGKANRSIFLLDRCKSPW